MTLPPLLQNAYDKTEKFSYRQMVATAFLIAVIGVVLGIFSGQILRQNPPGVTPTSKDSQNPLPPTYSGRIFALSGTEIPSGAGYTHKLVDSGGKIAAYLTSADDKLKVVLPTTEVTVEGYMLKRENGVPVISVTELRF